MASEYLDLAGVEILISNIRNRLFVNSLNNSFAGFALDARQGVAIAASLKALSDRITALENSLNNAKPPVGSILINVTGVSPTNQYPGTTWAQVASGRTLFGYSGTDGDFSPAEYMDGAKTSSHTHLVNVTAAAATTTGTTTPGVVGTTTPGSTGVTILTIAQMPAHSHTFTRAGTAGFGTVTWIGEPGGYTGTTYASFGTSGVNAQATTNFSMTATGGDAGHSHTSAAHTHTNTAHDHSIPTHSHTVATVAATLYTLPPYFVVYFWKRTA